MRNFRRDYFDAQKGDLMVYRKTCEFQESCVFVYVLLPSVEFFTHMETLSLQLNIYLYLELCSALEAIQQ